MIRLTVNGRPIELEGEVSITELLRLKGLDEAFVAVERNAELTRREDWARIVLKEGDRVEIVRIVGGG